MLLGKKSRTWEKGYHINTYKTVITPLLSITRLIELIKWPNTYQKLVHGFLFDIPNNLGRVSVISQERKHLVIF